MFLGSNIKRHKNIRSFWERNSSSLLSFFSPLPPKATAVRSQWRAAASATEPGNYEEISTSGRQLSNEFKYWSGHWAFWQWPSGFPALPHQQHIQQHQQQRWAEAVPVVGLRLRSAPVLGQSWDFQGWNLHTAAWTQDDCSVQLYIDWSSVLI